MLTIYFDDAGEIRAGSPHRAWRIRLEGAWVPELLVDDEWSNVSATSPDGTLFGLVRWDVVRNDPGFRVVTIDTNKRAVQVTGRLVGVCSSLMWAGGYFIPFVKP